MGKVWNVKASERWIQTKSEGTAFRRQEIRRTLQKTMARLWAHLSVIYAAECTGCSVHSQLAWNTGSVAAQAARVEPKVSGQTTDSVKKEDKTLSNTECLMTEWRPVSGPHLSPVAPYSSSRNPWFLLTKPEEESWLPECARHTLLYVVCNS